MDTREQEILRLILDALKTGIVTNAPAGASTSALQTTGNNSLSSLDTKATTNNTYTSYEVWDAIPGNSKEFTYYSGEVAGNPSGNTDNIQTIVYKTGVSTILTRTFTYNSSDNILTITAS
jgi:hypothetical protein